MEVLIKNVDCAACMEAPPATRRRRLGGSDPFKSRILSPKEVFVTALNCDADDPYQIWNLISLEPTGIWYLFESAETGECMQVVGQCTPDGSLYNIEMGPCDATNSKAIWGFTGIGEVISYECFRSNWESDNLYHSTPDIFLEGKNFMHGYSNNYGTLSPVNSPMHSFLRQQRWSGSLGSQF